MTTARRSAETLARKAIKVAALPAGAVRRRRPGDVVILLYHRVGDNPSEIELSAPMFERQLAFLADHHTVLTLDEALGDPGGGGVVVTVDDGYRDFHEVVLPLLVRYQVPAVLYLATSLVRNGGGPPDGLTWSQLEECAASGYVTVGSHTHSHADLSKASETAAAEEMRRAQELIEDRLGVACRHFAYPWAVAGPPAERAARQLFDSAALDAWRTNRRGQIDPWRLGRAPVLRSDGMAFFRAKVSGALDAESMAYRLAGRGPWGRA